MTGKEGIYSTPHEKKGREFRGHNSHENRSEQEIR
jgi:hypothetical protein